MTNEQIKNEASFYVSNILGLDYSKAETEQAFKAGASWRINSVWHDAKEEPKRWKLIIAENSDNDIELFYFISNRTWKEVIEENQYIHWAYVDDLLPEGKENRGL